MQPFPHTTPTLPYFTLHPFRALDRHQRIVCRMDPAFEDEVDETITIGELIEDMERRELEADLVLGGDQGKECTYSQGYMPRQAVFSCLTCVPDGSAGICTACTLACHDGHEVLELWTKRKFRCDCGNSKFGELYCKLCTDKDPENADNSYNQNFKGTYCTCGRPNPDPQAEEPVAMLQCCICEDWFHENHLNVEASEEVPLNEEGEPLFVELICQDCALKCSFLRFYPAAIVAASKENITPVKSCANENMIEHGSSSLTHPEKEESDISVNLLKCSRVHSEAKTSEKDSVNGVNTAKESPYPECIIGVDLNAASLPLEEKKPLFLSKNWRNLLCRCVSCSEFYKKMGIDFLIVKEDTMEEYENVAKRKREEKLQQEEGDELDFLNGLGHVQKIEILSGINDLKSELTSFMETYDASKPITPADVLGIFENLARKKKPRFL